MCGCGIITGHMMQWSPSGEPRTNGQGAELSRKWEENGYWAPGDQYMCHGLGEILEKQHHFPAASLNLEGFI